MPTNRKPTDDDKIIECKCGKKINTRLQMERHPTYVRCPSCGHIMGPEGD